MSPSQRPTRRRLLTALAGVGVVGAGCTSRSDPASRSSPTNTSSVSTTPSNATETAEETETPDIDERADADPPGSSALDPSGSWPSYRFNAGNTGYNPEGTGVRDGEAYWRLDAGGSAAISDGTLYNVYSRDRDTKTLTYRNPTNATVETRSPLVEYGVTSPPTVADGRVFVATFVEVLCFDATTGDVLWRGPEMDGIQAHPTVRDGTVFLNSSGYGSVSPHLRAFDAASGTERWRYDTEHESRSTPAVGDGSVFIASEGGLHAVDIATGEEEYMCSAGANRWETPVVRDGTVYTVASGSDSDELLAVETVDGSVRWRTEIDANGPPVVADDIVYATTGSELVALDEADGTVSTPFDQRGMPVARVGDVLYATSEGTVLAFDATTGDRLWSLRTAEVQISDTVGRAVYHVTPVDGAVYVSARDGFYGVGPGQR